MLVNMAISLGQTPDPTILKEIQEYYRIQESVKQSSKNFLDGFVQELKSLKNDARELEEKINQSFEVPKPPSLDDLFENNLILEDVVEEPSQNIPKPPSLDDLAQVFDLTEELLEPPKEEPVTLAKLASEHISKEVKLEEKSPFASPEINVEKTLSDLKKKIKFLEDWISKISLTGPGSGEVRLLNLDDVDTAALGNNKYLKYNSTTGKLEFASVSGGGGGDVTSVAGAIGDVSNVEILNGIVSTGYFNTANIAEESNLYFTNARAISAFTAGNNIVIQSNGQISANVTGGGGSADFTAVSSNIIPTANSVFDLGAPNLRWKTLYLANNTIDLGGALIQSDGTGALTISSSGAVLPVNSRVQVGDQDKPIALVGNSGTITTTVPFYTESIGLNTPATNFTFGFNPDDYVFTNFTFGNGQTITTGGITQFYF